MRWRLAMAHHDRLHAKRHLNAWNSYAFECKLLRSNILDFENKMRTTFVSNWFTIWYEKHLEIKGYDDIVQWVLNHRQENYLRRVKSN